MLSAPGATFGIELEFFLLDRAGYPAFGATARAIRRWREHGWPNPPVPELGSFQIELNPGPWPLDDAGLAAGLAELARDVERLGACAAELGLVLCSTALVPRVLPAQLADRALLADNPRSRATSSYFAHRGAVAEFADGTRLAFPGETVLACLNEIHIHVRLPDDARTIELFNAFNEHGDEIVRPYQSPLAINGKTLDPGCTTMRLFAQSDGELNRSGELRRVGYLPGPIRSAADYRRAVASFRPIPAPHSEPPYLELESSVWFWTRLRGAPGALRVEFRPMDMGPDWPARVRHLACTASRLSDHVPA